MWQKCEVQLRSQVVCKISFKIEGCGKWTEKQIFDEKNNYFFRDSKINAFCAAKFMN